MKKPLRNIVIVITGSSRGIGKTVSEALSKEGAKIVCISRSESPFKSKYLVRIPADVTDENQVRDAIEATIKHYGKIDVLINNVGMFKEKFLEEFTSQEFDEIINTNIKSMFLLSRTVIPYMKKRRNGLIINMGSKISHNTNISPKRVLYATTKYAVEGFSSALSKEVRKYGIRVSCLMPSTVNSFFTLSPKKYLSLSQIAEIISMMIKFNDIQFENLIVRSKYQNI